MKRLIILALVVVPVVGASVNADEAVVVTYEDHVRPILREHCFKCHGEDEQKADLNFSTYATLVKGGSAGDVVVAGRAGASLLFEAITRDDPEARMPPKRPPLPAEQIAKIRAWIDGGLHESAGSKSLAKARDLSFVPTAEALAKPSGPLPMPGRLPPISLTLTRRPLPIVGLAASPWAPLVAVSGHAQVRLIHAQTREPLGELAFPEGEPYVLRFSRGGKLLLAAGGRPVQLGKAVLFDVLTGKRLAEIGDEIDAVLAADLSPDQQLVAIGGSGRVVKVYSTEDGKLHYKLVRHTDWITALAFSPDGKQLATADRAGGIHLWDAETGGILLSLADHSAAVRAVAWRSDGRVLASGGEDGKLILWDAADGWPTVTLASAHAPTRPPGTFGKLAGGVLDVAFAADGRLASCGRDKRVRLWDSGGKLLQTAECDALPTKVAVSFDGRTLIAGDAAGELHDWPIGPGAGPK